MFSMNIIVINIGPITLSLLRTHGVITNHLQVAHKNKLFLKLLTMLALLTSLRRPKLASHSLFSDWTGRKKREW